MFLCFTILRHYFRARCDQTKGFSCYLSSYLIIYHFLSSLASLQTPEDVACSRGKHEAVKVLKGYAEVCGSMVMKGCVLNLDVFLSHFQSFALCLVLITYSLSLSFILSIFCFWIVWNTAGGHQRACMWLEEVTFVNKSEKNDIHMKDEVEGRLWIV